ncbi:hypothetical protein GGI20_002677 [Coemansia sp. BCRC 34301]|nr:hypothetical protein GGI20_002677 [Coemansia sp. BCRC 34301]
MAVIGGRRRGWRLAALFALLVAFIFVAGSRLRPWALGGLEEASYPTSYSQNMPAKLHMPPDGSSRANGCFVFITRTISLTKVRRTMFDIEQRFNSRFRYPYVFLSSQPFSDEFKRTVQLMAGGGVNGSRVEFGLIPRSDWSYPEWIDVDRAKRAAEAWADANDYVVDKPGWRHMVRYWAGPFARHPLLQKYKYVWRLEPGAHYTCDFEYDPILHMHTNGYSYGFAIATAETPDTVPTLFKSLTTYIRNRRQSNSTLFADGNSLGWIVGAKGYNRCHFLTNFEIVDLDFMRSDSYQELFGHLDRSGGIYYERWTDGSVRSLAVALLLRRQQVRWFEDVGYRHDALQNCPQSVERQMRCHCDPSKSTHLQQHTSCSSQWNTSVEMDVVELTKV